MTPEAGVGVRARPADFETAPHDVVVGVIDSGWDRSIYDPRIHAGVGLVDAADELTLGWSADDHDRNGHGTTATDVLFQVAPGVRAIPIRVFGRCVETSPAVLIAAIDWAVARSLRLVNLSLGTLREDTRIPLYRACERARSAGTVIVAAGANTGDGWSYPAVFDSVIGVGADDVEELHGMSYRSGNALECGARTIGLSGRGLGGRRVDVCGSSFAAPVVTGYIARLFQEYGPEDVAVVRERLAVRYSTCASRSVAD